MPRQIIDRIRNCIRNENYDMTHHAVEEMAEYGLSIFDIEKAILNGEIVRIDKNDPLGVKYTLKGIGNDPSILIGVVGRFKETGTFLIITVYKVS